MPLRPRLRNVLAVLTAGVIAATSGTAVGAPVATHVCSPLVGIDGYSDDLDKTEFRGVFVGNFSALAVDRGGDLVALSDRSEMFTLDGRSLRPTGVVSLADESGAALDSEGVVVERDGSRLVSSEGEPAVRRYSADGRILGRLPVPDALRVAPDGRALRNATFEGLTVQPGGRTLLAAMEAPLTGDSAMRVQTWHRDGRADGFRLAEQYGYRADSALGISEITAAGDGRLLVLERGFTAGVGNTVRLYLADLRRATDVSRVAHLTGQPEVRLAHKTLLADLGDCPSLGAPAKQPQPNPLLDNIEALAVTGHAPGGRLRLLLASDDNQNQAQITRFYHLTVRLPSAHNS